MTDDEILEMGRRRVHPSATAVEQLNAAMLEVIRIVRGNERERCAQIAARGINPFGGHCMESDIRLGIAAAIRES